ncbi:tyrosine-protein phosphatase [Streptomyces sp. NPDC059578]|uniref:tyrosine-protein phosphatase n=1 Tax=unclassified Streptomyces TaxID=2593676 RepID=UPI00365537D3
MDGEAGGTVADTVCDGYGPAEPEAPQQSRWVPLMGADNTRDLGGLPVSGGGTTRRGVVFRSSTLQAVTDADVEFLVDGLGLRTVVDLRGPEESAREGHGLLTATRVRREHLPVRLPQGRATEVVPDGPDGGAVDFYFRLLGSSADTLTATARIVADPDQHAVLFHCAIGKDRTGVCAAVLLDAVGVAAEVIAVDYELTAQRIARVRDRLLAVGGYHSIPDVGHTYMASRAETMHDFLARLHADHGGGAGWLLRSGLTEGELDLLRATLVAP